MRDRNGLESALASPQNLFTYGDPNPDIAAMAAQYAFAIARNRVFLDGNKRTALVVSRTILLLNRQNLIASNEDKYRAIMQLADGQLTLEQMANGVRSHLANTS